MDPLAENEGFAVAESALGGERCIGRGGLAFVRHPPGVEIHVDAELLMFE